jgi:hypothetical protein
MYIKRKKGSRKYNAARDEFRRAAEESPDYPPMLNFEGKLRKRITVEDFDFGVTEIVDLYGTDRIDLYRMEVSGKVIMRRIGWSRVIAEIRKAFPRVQSVRRLK